MYTRSLLTFATFALCASSAALLPRDANTVLARMDIVAHRIATVNATLNTFYPSEPLGIVTALKLQKEKRHIAEGVSAVIAAAKASAPWSTAETQRLVAASDYHQQLITSLLANVVAHKASFQTAVLVVGDVSKSVRAQLVREEAQTLEFGNAVQEKCQPGYVIPELHVQAMFEAAIAQFDHCGGVVCLPDLSEL